MRSDTLGVWGYRALLVALWSLVLFIELLPLGRGSGLPLPDLWLVLLVAVVLRRPEVAPFGVIVVLTVVMDFVLFRTPGAMTLALLVATEFVRGRGEREGDIPLAEEAAIALAAIIAALVLDRVINLVFAAPVPGLALFLAGLAITVLSYPLVAGAVVFILRLRRPDPNAGFLPGRPV